MCPLNAEAYPDSLALATDTTVTIGIHLLGKYNVRLYLQCKYTKIKSGDVYKQFFHNTLKEPSTKFKNFILEPYPLEKLHDE